MFQCVICKKYHHDKSALCNACSISLSLAKHPRGPSLFPYNEAVRSLILAAKIKGHLGALSFIITQFVNECISWPIVQHCNTIMPMPSSFWGRIKGRIDIAYHLAWYLSQHANKKFCRPPYAAGWHIKKQAMVNAKARRHEHMLNSRHALTTDRYTLVVDDLITTGTTYAKLQQNIAKSSTGIISFASARPICDWFCTPKDVHY